MEGTLVQEAVELELLDPFGGCFGCHCQPFLHALLSYSVLLPSSRQCDFANLRPGMKRVRIEIWEAIEIVVPPIKISRWLGNDARFSRRRIRHEIVP